MRFERHHSALIIASVITVAAFAAVTAYTQDRLARLDELSSTIETNSVPSIDYLSHAAVRLTRLNQLMDDFAAGGAKRASAVPAIRQEVVALDDTVDAYLRLTPLPGEGEHWAGLRADVTRAVQLTKASVGEGGSAVSPTAGAPPAAQVDDALDAALRSVLSTLEFDVNQSEILAGDVRQVRVATRRVNIALDAVATGIALFAVVIAYRASLRHDQLLNEHAALLAARVTELDRFAGRAAHDVLSPLGTIAAGLALLGRTGDDRGRNYVERSQRALQTVRHLVEDLLLFARAGAHPDPAASCSIDAVFGNVATDCSPAAAERNVELVIESGRSMAVACSLGITTSIVENLVRNAIKYMGTRTVRKVTVRASAVGRMARLQIEDTGPGIPADLHGRIFEPFVRAPGQQESGTGLGLAIVKRFAESHGGAVGVRSQAGAGSLFWVDLPMTVAAGEGATHSGAG